MPRIYLTKGKCTADINFFLINCHKNLMGGTPGSGSVQLLSFFFKDFIHLFLGNRGREGDKQQCVVASCVPPTGDLARNPGRDWESNL